MQCMARVIHSSIPSNSLDLDRQERGRIAGGRRENERAQVQAEAGGGGSRQVRASLVG